MGRGAAADRLGVDADEREREANGAAADSVTARQRLLVGRPRVRLQRFIRPGARGGPSVAGPETSEAPRNRPSSSEPVSLAQHRVNETKVRQRNVPLPTPDRASVRQSDELWGRLDMPPAVGSPV